MHMVSFWNELVGSRNVNISFTFVQPHDCHKTPLRKTNVSVCLIVCLYVFWYPALKEVFTPQITITLQMDGYAF